MLCIMAYADDIAMIGGIRYYLFKGEATVMKQETKLSGKVVIPEYISLQW